MKLRFLKNGVSDGTGRKFGLDDTADIPDDLAKQMIASGVAKLDGTPTTPTAGPASVGRMRRVVAKPNDKPNN